MAAPSCAPPNTAGDSLPAVLEVEGRSAGCRSAGVRLRPVSCDCRAIVKWPQAASARAATPGADTGRSTAREVPLSAAGPASLVLVFGACGGGACGGGGVCGGGTCGGGKHDSEAASKTGLDGNDAAWACAEKDKDVTRMAWVG